MTALVLAGHGSHISPRTAGLVWRYVDRLRRLRVADEVTACFWKEQPSFHEALSTVKADDVTVIPVFTAQGYFTQTVIPAEMGLTGAETRRGSRVIRYGKTLGEHPDLAAVIRQRVEDTLAQFRLNSQQTTVAIIGHGTRRNQHSQQATREQVRLLAQTGSVHAVLDAYLDDTPNIPSIYQRAATPDVIVVPFFLAPGSHVTIDVPNALNLPAGQTAAALNGKQIYYTDPVGTDESVCDLIIDLAHAAGLPETTSTDGTIWGGFPHVGYEQLIDRVVAERVYRFGGLLLSPLSVQPVNADSKRKPLTTPAELRAHLRDEPFRPLASSADLPANWVVPVTTPDMIPAVVETIYPGAVAAWSRRERGAFQPGSFAATLARQTGDFRALDTLAADSIGQMVESVCGRCSKQPVWFVDNAVEQDILPCGEPCNFWMSYGLTREELR